jgi:hypothetical protein
MEDIMAEGEERIEWKIVRHYRTLVQSKHPLLVSAWPIISGFNSMMGRYGDTLVVVLQHTGVMALQRFSGLSILGPAVVGVPEISLATKHLARQNLEKHFNLSQKDGIVFLDENEHFAPDELAFLLQRHEIALGIAQQKIFLSHKGLDKAQVRSFYHTLKMLGFDPWLDEDAMPAGTELERGLRRGLSDSCAAVFFVTPNFVDEAYLAKEIDYAIAEKDKKHERFAIITLSLTDGGKRGKVPDLLLRYVYKTPSTELEALREILVALPLKVGQTIWRA